MAHHYREPVCRPLHPRPVEAEMKDVIVIPLRHHALFSYLQSRLIDADIGRMYCRRCIMNCEAVIISLSHSAIPPVVTRCATPITRDA